MRSSIFLFKTAGLEACGGLGLVVVWLVMSCGWGGGGGGIFLVGGVLGGRGVRGGCDDFGGWGRVRIG